VRLEGHLQWRIYKVRKYKLCISATIKLIPIRHMFWGTFFETLHGMKELQLGVLKGYDKDIFRPYAPDVKSFMEAKEVPNHVTVCVDKISHPGTSSNQREVDLMKSLLPESEWKNIKITIISPSWYHFRYMNGKSFPKEVYSNDEEYLRMSQRHTKRNSRFYTRWASGTFKSTTLTLHTSAQKTC
jgi:hypothetical protein